MKKLALLVTLVVALGVSACCTLDENRKSRGAFLDYASVLESESAYIGELNLDPKELARLPDGSVDHDACVRHAEMLDVLTQGNAVMASAMRAWAEGEDVSAAPADVDYEALCAP